MAFIYEWPEVFIQPPSSQLWFDMFLNQLYNLSNRACNDLFSLRITLNNIFYQFSRATHILQPTAPLNPHLILLEMRFSVSFVVCFCYSLQSFSVTEVSSESIANNVKECSQYFKQAAGVVNYIQTAIVPLINTTLGTLFASHELLVF